MSLEAIKKVTELEEEMKRAKAAALAEAKQILADADKEGRSQVESTKSAAEAEVKKSAEMADKAAALQTEKIMEQAKVDADALSRKAEGKLDDAAQLIVGKVVNG